MRLSARYLLGITVLVMLGCTGTRTTIDPNPAIDPAVHRTFAWEVDPIEPRGRREGLYYIDHFLRRRVTGQLTSLGYRQVERAQADMLVGYRLRQTTSVDQGGVTSPQNAAGAAWDPPSESLNTEVYNHFVPDYIRRAQLELTLQSTADRQTLWRATLSRIVDEDIDNEEAVKDAINALVPRLFNGFPARTGN